MGVCVSISKDIVQICGFVVKIALKPLCLCVKKLNSIFSVVTVAGWGLVLCILVRRWPDLPSYYSFHRWGKKHLYSGVQRLWKWGGTEPWRLALWIFWGWWGNVYEGWFFSWILTDWLSLVFQIMRYWLNDTYFHSCKHHNVLYHLMWNYYYFRQY